MIPKWGDSTKNSHALPGFGYFILIPHTKARFWFGLKIKQPRFARLFLVGGERGIRTPGGVTLNGFQDRRNRPLCHLSAAKIQFF